MSRTLAGRQTVDRPPPNPTGGSKSVRIRGKRVSGISVIARGTGLSVTHVSKIFRGERDPSLKNAQKLAAFFGVSLGDLAQYLASLRPSEEPAA